MVDFEMSVKSNIDAFAAELEDFARDQLPFAVSLAINKVAKKVIAGEKEEITNTFPTATPFTKNGVSYIPSNKNKLEAVVFIKDIQSEYLEPYEFGGNEIPAGPGHVAMLRPINIPLNQYGNIPNRKVSSMKSSPNVFSGHVKLKDGSTIGGVFQRMKGRGGTPRLKILVRFADPHSVSRQLHYFERAAAVVSKNIDAALDEAMGYALATKK